MTQFKVAVLTSTRADFGILLWLLRAIDADASMELLLYVTGSHLATEFGYTINEIRAEGFKARREIPILQQDDTPAASAKAMSLALSGFSEAMESDQPDIIVVLGDRFEIVPVALAAVVHGIPVAHIHGGETSEGAVDEYFRHAVTKLATLHFPAAEAYRRRIIQMGENPDFVHNFGAPGLDHLRNTTLLSREELEQSLGVRLTRPTALVTYHPVTTEPGRSTQQMRALLDAILEHPSLHAIITKANADAEGRHINELLTASVRENPDRLALFDNLGSQRYFSCLRHLDLLIGNSSSGLIEAPSFARPAVNIGTRQKGRLMADNVIQVGNSKAEVMQGIETALSPDFQESLIGLINPYDRFADGQVSARICDAIKAFLLDRPASQKAFMDLPPGKIDCV